MRSHNMEGANSHIRSLLQRWIWNLYKWMKLAQIGNARYEISISGWNWHR